MLCSKQYIVENNFNLSKENNGLTFGKFKLTAAYKQLIDNIKKGYHEKAQLWSIQINISFEFNKLLRKITDFYFSDINISNPKLVHLIYSDMLIYDLEVLRYYSEQKHAINAYHNHQIIRNHLCQYISILTLSDKKKLPSLDKIKDDDFNFKLESMKQKIKYSGNNLSGIVIKSDDDKNLIIPINEIINIIQINDRQIYSESHLMYWLSWIYEYDKRFSKANTPRKLSSNIDDKFLTDMTWILWEVILYFGKQLPNNIIKKMLFIYCKDFKLAQKSKKKTIVIMGFLLILNTYNNNCINYPLYNNYELTMSTVLNINPLYDKVKNI